MGGLGLLGPIGERVSESTDELVPVTIGYSGSNGYRHATGLAHDVVHEYSFDALTVSLTDLSNGLLDRLREHPSIRYVEFDRTYRPLSQTTPWGVDRVGATPERTATIDAGDVDIAILDSGIDSTHPDLRANVGKGVSFTSSLGLLSDGSGSTESLGTGVFGPLNSDRPAWHDTVGHGTHIAGITAGSNDDSGIVGVAPSATLHAVRVLGSFGVGSTSDIAAGINHVVEQGWDVANLSLGGARPSNVVKDACQHAFENDTLLVAATGNNGPCSNCVRYPAAYSMVIGVGATTTDDSFASFSARGPNTDIVAPGQSIRSTYTTSVASYKTLSGTSMAAPHVGAAGGLLLASGYSAQTAKDRLLETTEDIGLSRSEAGSGLLSVTNALGFS